MAWSELQAIANGGPIGRRFWIGDLLGAQLFLDRRLRLAVSNVPEEDGCAKVTDKNGTPRDGRERMKRTFPSEPSPVARSLNAFL